MAIVNEAGLNLTPVELQPILEDIADAVVQPDQVVYAILRDGIVVRGCSYNLKPIFSNTPFWGGERTKEEQEKDTNRILAMFA